MAKLPDVIEVMIMGWDGYKMMYDALSEAVELYGKPGGPWNVPSAPGSWIEKAKAALRKARGEK